MATLVTGLMLLATTINATSILMEAHRAGYSIPLSQPFITEYTSLVSSLLLIPAVIWLAERYRPSFDQMGRFLAIHLGISIVFSLFHVAIFVALRKLLFGLQGIDYNFSDNLWLDFIYEYRKDAWGYILIVMGIYSYGFILSRLRGEAVAVNQGENAPAESAPDRFLVRKLGKEFVVRVDEVEWLEASGNYVNLHSGERIYPLRTTMAKLIETLDERGFVRIHRSTGVNLDYVDSLTPQDSGDCTVTLKSGHTINLSRRYRDTFRERFSGRAGSSAI